MEGTQLIVVHRRLGSGRVAWANTVAQVLQILAGLAMFRASTVYGDQLIISISYPGKRPTNTAHA